MANTTKVTRSLIDRIVKEELQKHAPEMLDPEAPAAEEVEAEDLADTLEKKVNLYKALKVEGNRLIARQATILEQKTVLERDIARLRSKKLKRGTEDRHGTHAA